MKESAVLRIIDANFNRAREALRVAEDYARFALDSIRLTEELKGLRHRLREAVEALGVPADALLAARDTAGDVGIELSTPSELRRADAASVAMAAFKRLGEALRCLEEYGKTLNADAARAIQDLRYRGYELELQMFRLPRHRLAEAVLYVLLHRPGASQEQLLGIARAALMGGADVLQLRQKEAPGREVFELARALREVTREHDALLIINDRPDIAALADADGVHLGQSDVPVRAARRLLGAERIIGATANTVESAAAAEAEGADYIGCGAMFPSITKPDRQVVGPRRWGEVSQAVRIPVFALGGIEVAHLDELRAAGVDRVAVSYAIVAAADVEAAARAFREKLQGRTDA
jgi:thiamine-phosphate pyrophosphorylase